MCVRVQVYGMHILGGGFFFWHCIAAESCLGHICTLIDVDVPLRYL